MQASPLHGRIVEKGDNLTVYLQVGPKGRLEPTKIEGKKLSFWGKVWNFFFRSFIPVNIESRDIFLSKTSLKKNLASAKSRSFTRDPKANADKIRRYIIEEHFKSNPLMASALTSNIPYKPLAHTRRGRHMPKDTSENPLLLAKRPKENSPTHAESKTPLLRYSRTRKKKPSSEGASEEPKPVRRSPGNSRSSTPTKEQVPTERTPFLSKSSSEPKLIRSSRENSPIGLSFKEHIQRLEKALRSIPFLGHVSIQHILKLEDDILPYRELKEVIRQICKIPAEIRFAPDMRKASKELLSKMRIEEAKPTTTEDQKAIFSIIRHAIVEKLSKA